MPLHLIKLCVGVATIAELRERIVARVAEGSGESVHVTRMLPTRAAELLAGGSLFWVIAGQVAARQRLVDIRPFTDEGGVKRCRLVLEASVVAVLPRPHRVFQGWRYLPHEGRPADLGADDGLADLPEALRRELRDLCLL